MLLLVILCLKGIFLIQLHVNLLLWIRLSQIVCHFPVNNLNFTTQPHSTEKISHGTKCYCYFPCNSQVRRYYMYLAIKFTFSCLGLHPITCQFLLDSLHLIMYSTQMGQSTDRQLPNKEPMLLCFEI